MLEWLTPEFVASNATGAGASAATVYMVMKAKMEVLHNEIKNIKAELSKAVDAAFQRINRLEDIHLNKAD